MKEKNKTLKHITIILYIFMAIQLIQIVLCIACLIVQNDKPVNIDEPAEIQATEPAKNGSVTDPKSAYYPLTDEDRAIVERVVAAESLYEEFEGQKAVAQCILNTARKTGKTPAAVVLEPGQYATPLEPEEVTEGVKKAVSDIFDEGNLVTEEPIQYFYAPRWCDSEWHESLPFVMQIGGHRFFTEG